MNDSTNEGKPMTRKSSSFYDYDELRREAEELRDAKNAENELKKNLMFDEKEISIFRIYCHLTEKIDILFLALAIIGSLGSGLSLPIMAYISSDLMGDVGNTSEYADDPLILIDRVKGAFNTQIKRFLYFGAIAFVCNFLAICFWSYVGSRMCHRLKRNYFTIILSQEQGWFDANNAFEFATKVQAQLEQVEFGVGEKLGLVIQMFSSCIISFIFAFIISWKIALIMLVVAPFILVDVFILVTSLRTGIIMGRKTWEKAGGLAEEMLYNIKTVASFANFEFETRRFNEKVELCYQLDLGTVFRLGICIGFLIFFLNLSFVVAILYGRTLIGHSYNQNKGKDYTAGDVMCSALCTLMGIMGIGLTAPNIKVKNIKFVYPSDPNKKVILEGLNLTFEPGKKVALVGESGCGKSTTVNLIERLYEATDGEILIDGLDIKRYDIKYLRSLIGYVQQEPVLFNKSIRENLIFGREEQIRELGDVDDLIQNACDESYATEFISKLPDELNYVVGIKGSKLSGGQKQRVAIARAILHKPKILILDEATSALDNKSEKEVQRALDNISQKNVTTVIIAHRLSTIKNADLIYAIKEGRVIEQGTHKELLAQNGYYAGLVRSQLAQDEIETKEELEIREKKSSLKRRNTDEEVQFRKQDDELYIEEDTVKVNPCRIVKEVVHEHCCILVLAIIGAVGVGASQPVNGFVMAKCLNGMNSMYETIRYDDTLYYCWFLLLIAFLQGVFNFLMIWMFSRIGVGLARIYRKKILRKYLQFHISFYDITKNAPGSLLTRLSIDTMQLNNLVFSTVGSTVQVSVTFVLGLIMGCIYEYRLCLIMFVFVPFIAVSIIIRRSLNSGSGKRGVKANVEAGGILSECVTNTKTIYSYNFQQPAVEMYMNALEYQRRKFLKDAIIAGMLGYCILNPTTYNYIDNMCDAIRHYKSNSGTTVIANSNLIEHMKQFNNLLFNLIGLKSYDNIIDELTGIIRDKIKEAKKKGLRTAVIQNSPGSCRSA